MQPAAETTHLLRRPGERLTHTSVNLDPDLNEPLRHRRRRPQHLAPGRVAVALGVHDREPAGRRVHEHGLLREFAAAVTFCAAVGGGEVAGVGAGDGFEGRRGPGGGEGDEVGHFESFVRGCFGCGVV